MIYDWGEWENDNYEKRAMKWFSSSYHLRYCSEYSSECYSKVSIYQQTFPLLINKKSYKSSFYYIMAYEKIFVVAAAY